MTTIRYVPSIFMGIDELEDKLGLSKGFFDALVEEDDWSFVIKLHALFEAVCSHLLVYHFREEAIKEVVSKLELSNKSTGKIAFLKALGLLGKDERRYIYSLSELRNRLVHDVRQSSFKLKDMVAALDEKEMKSFAKTFSPSEAKTVRPDVAEVLKKAKRDKESGKQSGSRQPLFVEIDLEGMKELVERARTEPKVHIWAGALNVLLKICDMYGYSTYRQEVIANKILSQNDNEI